MNDNALCPRCGSDLLRSSRYPHGRDFDGVIRKARLCQKDNLYWGQAFDGSWSVSVEPLNMNHTVVSRRRSKPLSVREMASAPAGGRLDLHRG
jgi:hypothetical protein